MNFKRFFACLVALSISFSGATFASEKTIVADSTVHTVSPGLVYSSTIELYNNYRQEIHSFEYTPGNSTEIMPIYGKYIYGTSSVGQGISDYDGDSRVVGGINTDFFITNTGVPLSCLIDNREVVSSCDGRAAIGFNEDGSAVIGYPEINSKLYFGDEEFPIAHINKTPAIWGMYLVTDKFYSTTKSSVESIEIVLRPFIDEKSEEEMAEVTESSTEVELAGKDDIESVPEIGKDIEEVDDVENGIDVGTDDENTQEEPPFDFSTYSFTDENIEINSELQLVITEIRDNSINSEIPEGCFVLCVPKEQFGNNVSHLKVGDELTLKTEISEKFENCKNIFGAGDIILEDSEIIDLPNENLNKDRHPRTAVGIKDDGSVIFICVDGRRKGESYGFSIKELSEYLKNKGCVTALNFDGGGSTTFYAADIGEEYANLKNIPSDGYERRVSDGLIFLNTSQSGGVPSYAAKYPGNHLIFNEMVELELSGNILFADEKHFPIKPEYDYYSLVVDEEFGKTRDGVFTPNGKTGSADIILQVRKGDSFTEFEVGRVNIVDGVSDFVIKSEDTHITPFEDSAVFEISVTHNTLPILYSDESIVWEIYIKDESNEEETSFENTENESTVVAEDLNESVAKKNKSDEQVENGSNVDTTEKNEETEDTAETGKSEEAGEVKEPEETENSKETEEAEGTEDTEKVDSIENYTQGYTKASIYDAIFDNINFEFYPFTEGKEYRLVGKLGNSYAYVDITSEKYPFIDTEKHWASKTVYELYTEGYFKGELDYEGNRFFMPGRSMTRSEFCTLIGRILSINVEEVSTTEISEYISENEETIETNEAEEKESFYDVPDWAIGYVKSLYEMGYIDNLVYPDENGVLILDSQRTVTRMDVVTVFSHLLDFYEFENYDEVISEFSDIDALNEEQKTSTAKLVLSGIIKGYGDNTLRLTSDVTRAEVATIFHRYDGLCDFILSNQT